MAVKVDRESGIVYLLPVFLVASFLIVGVLAVQKEKVTTNPSQKAVLSKSSDDSGGDSDNSGSGSSSNDSGSDSSGSRDNSGSGSSGDSNETKSADTTTTSSREREQEQEQEREMEHAMEQELEREATSTPNPRTRVRVKSEDGKQTVELIANGVKLKYEFEDGKLKIKSEDQNDNQVEINQEDQTKIDARLAETGLKIRTEGDKFVVEQNNFSATSTFPLSVDLNTNTLSVTTPSGIKQLTVLPAAAVRALISAGVIDTTTGNIVPIGINNDTPVLEVDGVDNRRILGIIPIGVRKTVQVSAQDGSVVSTNFSFFNRILNAISS